MKSAGIDYGLGRVNVDCHTGIRYGVISQHSILQAWADSSEPDYDSQLDDEPYEEPIRFVVNDEEYSAESCLDNDVILMKAPYYTFTQFCSPCVPGAGNLDQPSAGGVKTYAFGHDWFEDGKAPYPVYRVADDEVIESPFLA